MEVLSTPPSLVRRERTEHYTCSLSQALGEGLVALVCEWFDKILAHDLAGVWPPFVVLVFCCLTSKPSLLL